MTLRCAHEDYIDLRPCRFAFKVVKRMKRLDFNQTLLEAVDHALLSLGESPRQAVYYHLNKSFKLQREEIPEVTDEFSEALTTIFGPGAEVIEKIIVRNLYDRLNLDFDEKRCFEFAEYVTLARELAKREQQLLRVEKAKRTRRSSV